MKKLTFETAINAPLDKVFSTMIDAEQFKKWTSAFNPNSYYEGSWNKGDKILFIGISEEGKKGGMVSKIAENIPNKFISIHHYGILDGENEITEGPQVEGWAGALENYTFTEKNGITTVTVDVDITEEYQDYFTESWPKALNKLKEIVEN